MSYSFLININTSREQMTSKLYCDVKMARTTGAVFSNTEVGDMIIYSETSNQRIHIGPSNNSGQAALSLSTSNVIVSGDIIPSRNIAFDLGSSNFRFRDLYLSGSTIDLGGTKIQNQGQGIVFKDNDNNLRSLVVDELVIGNPSACNVVRIKNTEMGTLDIKTATGASTDIIASNVSTTNLTAAGTVLAMDIATSNINTPNVTASQATLGTYIYKDRNVLFPKAALAQGNPTTTYNGITYTFSSTNQFGDFYGNYLYTFSANDWLVLDQYTNGIFTGTQSTGGILGHHLGIIGSSAFVLTGYRFLSKSTTYTTYPRVLYLMGSQDATTWTTIDVYTVPSTTVYSSSVLEVLDGGSNNTWGLDRKVGNITAYKYYRLVINELFGVGSFSIVEQRWYLEDTYYYSKVSTDSGSDTLTLRGSDINLFGTIRTSNQLFSTVATGTAPFDIISSTMVTNLNANFLNGQADTFYRNADNINAGTLQVARGGTGVATSTGTGNNVLSVAPILSNVTLLNTTTANGINSSNITAGTINVTTALQTGSVTRIDANGVLSNISAPSNATNVFIDASRITTGVLGSAVGGTGVATSTGTGSNVLSTAPTLSGVTLLNTTTANFINGSNINATTALQTGGVIRIDANGILSNVSAPSNASNVLIDASRITTGILRPNVGGTGTTTSTGTGSVVLNNAPSFTSNIDINNGNGVGGFSNSQILFESTSGGAVHAIKTRHNSSANTNDNAIDFFLWQTTDSQNVGSKQVVSITSAGVGINTTAPQAHLHVASNAQVDGILQTSMYQVKQDVFPPDSMSSNMATFTNSTYGQGSYTVNASSFSAGFEPYMAFDKSADTWWRSANNTYTNGNVTSGASTTYTGGTYAGEWIEIIMPQPILLSSVELSCRADGTSPFSFRIFAANGAETYVSVSSGYGYTSASWVSSTFLKFTTTQKLCTSIRIAVNQVLVSGSIVTCNIREIKINGKVVGIPTYSWASDSNTGISYLGPSTFALTNNNTSTMVLAPSSVTVNGQFLATGDATVSNLQVNGQFLATGDATVSNLQVNGLLATSDATVSNLQVNGLLAKGGAIFRDTTVSNLQVNGKYIGGYEDSDAPLISSLCNMSVIKKTPGVKWGVSFNGTGVDLCKDIAVDNNGFVYLAGSYTSTTNVALLNANGTPSSVILKSTQGGFSNAYVCKYTSEGVAQWAGVIESLSNNTNGNSVVVDGLGNVYLAGDYTTSNIVIYNASNIASPLTLRQPINFAPYIVKFNGLGVSQWVVTADSSNIDVGNKLVIDNSSNVYLAGNYVGTNFQVFNANNIASSVSNLRTPTNYAAYLLKYDSNGTAQWAVSADAGSVDYGMSVAADGQGNIFLAGRSTGASAVTVYNSNNTVSSLPPLKQSSGSGGFVVKYNSNGVAQWGSVVDASGGDTTMAIAADISGNVFLGGWYSVSNLVVYKPDNTSGVILRSPSANAAYVIKYNSVGTPLFGVTVDGTGTETTRCIAVDASGDFYVSGNHNSTTPVTIYNSNDTPSYLTIPASTGGTDGYVVKFNANGIAQWYLTMNGTGSDSINAISVDNQYNIHFAGEYNNTPTLYYNNDVLPLTLPTISTLNAVFACKFTQPYMLLSDLSDTNNGQIKQIYNAGTNATTVEIRDASTSNLRVISIDEDSVKHLMWYGNDWREGSSTFKDIYASTLSVNGYPIVGNGIFFSANQTQYASGNPITFRSSSQSQWPYINYTSSGKFTVMTSGIYQFSVTRWSTSVGLFDNTIPWRVTVTHYGINGVSGSTTYDGVGMMSLMLNLQAGQSLTINCMATRTIYAETVLSITNQAFTSIEPQYQPGLFWKRYDNTGSGFSMATPNLNFFTLNYPDATGTVQSMPYGLNSDSSRLSMFGISNDGNDVALSIQGLFRASETGTWTVSLVADDVAYLWLGDSANSPKSNNFLINTTSSQYPAGATSTIYLQNNVYYNLQLYWGQSSGGGVLKLQFTSPSGKIFTDGTGCYYHNPTNILPREQLVSLLTKDSYSQTTSNVWSMTSDVSNPISYTFSNKIISSNEVYFNGVDTFALASNLPLTGSTFSNGLSMAVYYYRNGNPSVAGAENAQGSLLCVNRDAANWLNAAQNFENGYTEYGQCNFTWKPNTTITGSNSHHFRAFTRSADGKTIKAYYNGMPDGQVILASNSNTLSNNSIGIGINVRDRVSGLNGNIKAHAIYNRTLKDAEIASIYQYFSTTFM